MSISHLNMTAGQQAAFLAKAAKDSMMSLLGQWS